MTDVLRYIALPTGAGLMHARSLIAAVAIVVALMGGVVLAAPAQAYPAMPQGVQGPFTVTKVVDGDTIWVDNNGKREKIRMIGMDTPETVDPRKPVQCFGLEASAQAKTILSGQSVYLESDPSQDTVDKYGRTLAYVWTTSGRLFNLDMIADGYAHEYTYYWCVLDLADSFKGDASACDFSEDGFGGRGPDVRPWVVIVSVDIFLDRGDQVGNGMKCPAPQRLVGQLAKPPFHQVQPG